MSDYDKCVRFEEGLQYDLQVSVALQKERVFAALVDKAKIVEEVQQNEHKRHDHDRDQSEIKRDFGPSGSRLCPKRRARFVRPLGSEAPTIVIEIHCSGYWNRHLGKC